MELALNHIDMIQADMGGTDIILPLTHAIDVLVN